MPWMERCPVDLRREFLTTLDSELYSMAEVCCRYGVSRKTGYKWLKRREQEGANGLGDLSRRPRSSPKRTPSEIEELVVEARKGHPDWGPRKLLRVLERTRPALLLPARSTVAAILKRQGMIRSQRRKSAHAHPGRPFGQITRPNQLWTADFKGQFRTQDGIYCYPLTVADQCSRYLLACVALPSTRNVGARPVFEQLFRQVGLPDAIRTDNGVPFATTGIHGLSALNVWWMQLGIRHERIEPGRPEQNGCHERMHRTLKRRTTRPPAASLKSQQRAFDEFMLEFNHVRPHEALKDETPASVWQPSTRSYPEEIRPPQYPGHYLVRLVCNAGTFRFKCRQLFISQALKQQFIGLEEVDDGVWSIYFYDVLLGRLDEQAWRIVP
jgi:putative transposase